MRLLRLTLFVVLAAISYTACSDDDYGRSLAGDDGGVDGGDDASAVSDLGTHD